MSDWTVRHDRALAVSIYVALTILLTIPMLLATVPLGVDDLNHLARIFVRSHIETDPDLAREFVLKGGWVPYQGADVLLTALARILPVFIVGRICIVILVLGLVAAVAVVRRVFVGKIGLAPAAAGLIAYNGLIAWGLIIYTFGVILALLLFAMWHAWRERSWWFRLLVFAVGSTLLYLTHVVSLFTYGVVVASYELLGRKKPWKTPLRDWIILIGQAVPALLLWSAVAKQMISLDPGQVWNYNPAIKISAILFPFLFRGAAGGLELGVILAVIFEFALYVGIRQGLLTMPRLLFAPAMVMIALTIGAPFMLFGEGLFDLRFSVLAACLFLAGLQLTPKISAAAVPIAALIGLMTAVRVADVSLLISQCDKQYKEAREAFAGLPRGATIYSVVSERDPDTDLACTGLPIFDHMALLATIDRSDYSSTFFARATSVGTRGNLHADEIPPTPENFVAPSDGFVFWVHWGRTKPPPSGFVLFRHGSFFDIWAKA